jgi:hypothetical protein
MSMIGSYRSLSENELDALIANPAGIVDFLFNDYDPACCQRSDVG